MSFPPPAPPPPAQSPPPIVPVPTKVSWWRRKAWLPVWAWILVVLILIGGAAAAVSKKDNKKTRTAVATTIAAVSKPATSTSNPATTVAATEPATTQATTTTVKPTTTSSTSTTSTSTTTTTTLPPAPIAFSGKGDDVVDIGAGNDRFILQATHDGTSNFQVELLDAALQPLDFPFNEIGKVNGATVAMNISNGGQFLRVKADGNWTLQLLDASTLPTVSDTFTGAGKAVVLYTGAGGIFTMAHDGQSNFQVELLDPANGQAIDFLVNEIGVYNGRNPLAGGPVLIAINADGNWAFAILARDPSFRRRSNVKNIRVDGEGEFRCWNCGMKGLLAKRTFRSKMLVGVGALLTKKKLKCQTCGEFNDTGNAQPFTGPEARKWRKVWEKEQARKSAAQLASEQRGADEAVQALRAEVARSQAAGITGDDPDDEVAPSPAPLAFGDTGHSGRLAIRPVHAARTSLLGRVDVDHSHFRPRSSGHRRA